MRGDLCSHAEGTLIPELQRQGLRIPLQPVPVIDDNGYICVDPPVDIRRELLDHKEKFAVIEHDIQVLTAKIEYLVIRKGVTSDELDAGARQHLGAVVDTLVPTATPRKHAKAETTADGSGQMEVARTPPTRALAAVPSVSPCPAPHTPAVKDSQVTAGDATPAVVRQQQPRYDSRARSSRRWNRWREWRAAMAGLDDAQPVETRSRRKGRVSRAISDVEEVEATTQTTEDQPMAEEPEDPPEDYTDDDESVDDDAVYEPGNDDFDEEDDWEEVNRAEGDA
ncbi:unnamed protein product [Closterium sp. Naga37s-1]|nr:unnamed protein product [Closterium sp. Naga37s-1]